MNILIIGNGMYVSGRGTTEFGTIMPALMEFHRETNLINNIYICGTSIKHSEQAQNKVNNLKKLIGINLNVHYFPNKKNKKVDYTEVIKKIKKFTCAIIAVPDSLHYQITKNCLLNGIHALIVKPFTTKVKDAKSLIELSKRKNLYGMVEFHKRWDRHNIMLKDYYESGKLGDPLYSIVEYSQRNIVPTKFFKNWVRNSNLIQYLAVHYIDIIRFVTKATPIRVSATGQKNWLRKKGYNIFDSIQCNIEWKTPTGKKFVQSILTNWIDPNNSSAVSDQKIKFIGTKGRFESDQKERGIRVLLKDKNLIEPNPDFCHSYGTTKGNIAWKGYGIDSIKTFLNDVCIIKQNYQNIKFLINKRPTFSEGLLSTAIIESANISLKQKGRWIKIKF